MILIRKKKENEDEVQSKNDFDYSEEESDNLPEFGEGSYWDDRYKNDSGFFDWYFDWWRVSPLLKDHIGDRKNKVLVLGCGNSTMSSDMVKDGFQKVYNIDISSVVINNMRDTFKDEPRLIWEEMNCAKMSFEDNFFDLCIDKGTLDAIVCNIDDVNLMKQSLKEIHRTLKPGGRFISITFGSPSRRLHFYTLEKLDWKLLPPFQMKQEDDDERDIHHYIYIFEKNMQS